MSTTLAPKPAEPQIASAVKPSPQPESSFGWLTFPFALLCLGHLTVDLYSSIVGTLQPVLVERYSLSLAQAGVVGGTFMLASSVAQLFFGLISDRLHSRMFTVLSPAAAGLFLSSLGMAGGYTTLLLLTFLGGLGVAAFHPQATTQAGNIASSRRGLGVAIFITSGTFGLSLGPIYFSFMMERVGLDGLTIAAVPGVLATALFFFLTPEPDQPEHAHRPMDLAPFRRLWKPLTLQYSLVVLRSVVQVGMGQFLTLYLYNERGFTLRQTSLALTLFFGSAALGSFLGGGLADRIGGRKVALISMAASAPFLIAFVGTRGWVSMALLFVGGTLLLLTIPVIVVMSQQLVPSQAGTATALMMGFAWGMAGIVFVPLIGWAADRVGLDAVFWALAVLPLAGFVLALELPAKTESPA